MKKLILMVLALCATPAFADSYTSFWVNDGAQLQECGGTVDARPANDGKQVELVFSNVEVCSNFDILRANGEFADHPNMKLQGRNGDRSGSFTIAKRYMEFGDNTITIRVKSNSGKHTDYVTVRFLDL